MATHVSPFPELRSTTLIRPLQGFSADALKYLLPIGRVLFALIFILAAPNHFSSQTVTYAARHAVPLASLAVPVAGIMSLVGGLSVALGFKTRFGAWLLIFFLVPVTLWMHAFWDEMNPMLMQMQFVNFLKNLALIGGALVIAFTGGGPFSVDEKTERARVRTMSRSY